MGQKQYSSFAVIRRASDQTLLTGLSGNQYPCNPKHMLFGGMAEGKECIRTSLIRELPEELGFDEDHYTFLHAVYNDDFGGAVNASARIMERIREENAYRLENAATADVARAIEAETALKQSFSRQALTRIANMPKDQLAAAMDAQDRANQVIAHIEGRLTDMTPFFEHLEEVSQADKDQKAWLDVHSYYFSLDLSDNDYAALKNLLALKITMGLDYEVSAYTEMDHGQMRAAIHNNPQDFLYEPQRLALARATEEGPAPQAIIQQQRTQDCTVN